MANGRAITNAIKSLGERHHRIQRHLLIALCSCKHLCCREGVDKKPKPPKSAYVPASSLIDPKDVSTDTSKRGNGIQMSKSKPSVLVSLHGGSKSIINRKGNNETRKGPLPGDRNFKMLDEIAKPRSVVCAKDSKLSRKGAQELHCSTPSHTNAQDVGLLRSTSESDEWADGLPPIEEFLAIDDAESSFQDNNSLGHGFSANISPDADNHKHNGEYARSQNVLHSEASEPIEAGAMCDIEEALIGLGDSISIQEAACSQSRDKQTHSDKLFFSTDSPEKSPIKNSKRKAFSDTSQNPVVESQPRKKQRDAEDRSTDSINTVAIEKQQEDGFSTTIKPGLPSWVYDFDPTFVREYQDYVEFV